MNISLNYLVTYLENYLVNIDVNYLENFLKGFICIHFLVTMDPRQQTDAEDEQFLLNMIAEGGGAQGDAPNKLMMAAIPTYI